MSEYKTTINVNIYFVYYPLKKQDSIDCPKYIDKSELAFYDDWEDIEITITPKMLVEAIKYVYDRYDKELGLSYQKVLLIDTFENCPYFFEKICAEIFDDENKYYMSSFYDYLVSCESVKKNIEEIIKDKCRGLGELYR